MIAIASCGHNCDDERIYYKQIKALSSKQFKIQYYTYCYQNYLDDELDSNLVYKFFSSSEISQKQYKQLLFNQLNNNPPTIFHIHDMELLSVAYALKKNHSSMKIIYDVHEDLDAMWDTFSSYSGIIKTMINWGLARYEKKYLSCVDHFISANRFARKEKYQKHAPVSVIENFLSLSNVQKIDKIQKPYKFIYHGQLSYERGIIDLLDAFNTLSNSHGDIELTLIGNCRTDDFKTVFLSMVNLYKNVHYIEQIPHNEIWTYLSEADIGVIPFKDVALCQYNTPTKLFEYMATNCGIVASDLEPIKSFCTNSAAWASPGNPASLIDAMGYYINNIEQYNDDRLMNNTLIKEKYNWDSISDNLISIYKELLQ